MVQEPPVTLTEVTRRIQPPFAVGGRSVRCSALPQLRRARYAEFWPPPDLTQALRVYVPSVRPVRYWYVSTL